MHLPAPLSAPALRSAQELWFYRPGTPKGVWGPRGWGRLHCLAIEFPRVPTEPQRRAALAAIRAEIARFPCPECQGHALAYLQAHPPDLAGSVALQAWMFTFHNAVNARLGRPLFSFAEYLRLYSDELALAACGAGCLRALRPPPTALGPALALLARAPPSADERAGAV